MTITRFRTPPAPQPVSASPSGVRPNDWQLSEGEIHFLYWFIQGSIMIPETRWRLRRAWGLCERHAWSSIAVEAAFRHCYFHGPAVLYTDLIERACAAFDVRGPLAGRRIARALRDRGPCLMCDCGLDGRSRGAARADLIERGRDVQEFRGFVTRTEPFWRSAVCGTCVGSLGAARCRRHFRDDAAHGVADVDGQYDLVRRTFDRLRAYAQSFVWGYQGTETDEDRAALIVAVGWCSGWQGFGAFVPEAFTG
jgi:hypothetical protein